MIAAAIAVVLIVLAASAIVVVTVRGSNGTAVALEPVGSVGRDPFATLTATEVTDLSKVQPVVATAPNDGGVVVTGTTPGLYGGTQDSSSCDAGQIKAFLHDNPAKAGAWAAAAGLQSTDEIDAFIDGLVPVVLTVDTWVTNHGYRNGKATPFPAVLQAGTAVLVDDTGVPRVKCSCGNPLQPPPASGSLSSTTGTAWPGYDSASVTTVSAGAPVSALDIVDVTTGGTFPITVGGGGGGVVVAVTGTDGADWQVLVNDHGFDDGSWEKAYDLPAGDTTYPPTGQTQEFSYGPDVGVAYGNGTFLAVAGRRAYASDSTGRTWHQVGSSEDELTTVAWAGDRWVGGGRHSGGGTGRPDTAVVYESTDGVAWTQLASLPGDDGSFDPRVNSITYADGRYVATVTDIISNYLTNTRLLTSTNGKDWSPTGQPLPSMFVAEGDGGGFLALGFRHPDIDRFTEPGIWTSEVSRDGISFSSAPTAPTTLGASAATYMDGRWYATLDDYGSTTVSIGSSADGVSWTRLGTISTLTDAWVHSLANSGPPSRSPDPVAVAPTTSPPTTQSPPSPTTSSVGGAVPPEAIRVVKQLFSTADSSAHEGACGGDYATCPVSEAFRAALVRFEAQQQASATCRCQNSLPLTYRAAPFSTATAVLVAVDVPTTPPYTVYVSVHQQPDGSWLVDDTYCKASAGDTNPYSNALTGANPGACSP